MHFLTAWKMWKIKAFNKCYYYLHNYQGVSLTCQGNCGKGHICTKRKKRYLNNNVMQIIVINLTSPQFWVTITELLKTPKTTIKKRILNHNDHLKNILEQWKAILHTCCRQKFVYICCISHISKQQAANK